MSRNIFIDGFDPDLIPGFELDQIRPDAIPDKVINSVRIAQADGEKYIGSNYVNKKITIKGHFYAATRADYEIARDVLLGCFDPERQMTMMFEQSNEYRKYTGIYENMQFEYKDNGFCLVTILIRCTDPFGYSVNESTLFSQANVTDELISTFDSEGNVYGLTKIVATVNSVDTDETERTMSFTISQGSNTYNIQINRIFVAGDTLTIDSTRQRVYVNGAQVEFTGRWPQVLKTNTFRFNMPDAASFDVDLLVTYKKRWL